MGHIFMAWGFAVAVMMLGRGIVVTTKQGSMKSIVAFIYARLVGFIYAFPLGFAFYNVFRWKELYTIAKEKEFRKMNQGESIEMSAVKEDIYV